MCFASMYELSRPARPSRRLRRVSSIFCCGGVCCQFFGLLAKPLSCTRLSGAVAIHRRSAVQILAYEAAASPQVRYKPRNWRGARRLELAACKTLAISQGPGPRPGLDGQFSPAAAAYTSFRRSFNSCGPAEDSCCATAATAALPADLEPPSAQRVRDAGAARRRRRRHRGEKEIWPPAATPKLW